MKTIRTIHNRKRLRLKGFDYSRDNAYYVTICVNDHKKCFGSVLNGRMELNEFGNVVHQQFEWMQNQYPYITIPVWVVMPDHVHAIIEINGNAVDNYGGTGRDLSSSTGIRRKISNILKSNHYRNWSGHLKQQHPKKSMNRD